MEEFRPRHPVGILRLSGLCRSILILSVHITEKFAIWYYKVEALGYPLHELGSMPGSQVKHSFLSYSMLGTTGEVIVTYK